MNEALTSSGIVPRDSVAYMGVGGGSGGFRPPRIRNASAKFLTKNVFLKPF